ncbi:hypothetical protein FBEOM_4508 [Fusarium beomiforme]|uniref:Uncharacterized protein n=1 Tax=Fusarium beomiforme TaxID=44412 RepID=A0A9P5DY68_9HYPO|nr:hypothetical protein FBEOM_4508 [Fusarium beomiforme]
MAQMLAPYNNAMRLGQGFNSYTQQICLDRAVLPDTKQANPASKDKTILRKSPIFVGSQQQQPGQEVTSINSSLDGATDETSSDQEAEPSGEQQVVPFETSETRKPDIPPSDDNDTREEAFEVHPWVKPQIVTYSSRFVDKLSDVTDAMNISGSLSIKTSTIGGKASGSYVDSDKFKSSDINFHLQVRVTNQIHDAKDYCIFNKIESLKDDRFAEVYGDSFISGWEEGGELNAIVSVKVLDKSKIFQVKAGIEAEMTTPSIAGKVKADVDIQKSNLGKQTETTVAVNWSGGGSIKHPLEDWTIDSLKKAAAAFPDLVAITPQRTYAILTKYSALEDFHKKNTEYDVLSYENAGIYTGSLLDSFMDYKMLWKQISNATYELEGNRATIDMGEVTAEMARLAAIKHYPMSDTDRKKISDGSTHQQLEAPNDPKVAKQGSTPTSTTFAPFQASFAGLIEAKKVCRSEMAKIVREVDLVAKNPLLATDGERDSFFLNPLVFKQLLPIVRSLSPENAVLGVRDPSATILLGYHHAKPDERSAAPVYKLERPLQEHCSMLVRSIQAVSYKSLNYRMEGCVGPTSNDDIHSQAEIFNDLGTLDQTHRLVRMYVWSKEERLEGIELGYASGITITQGNCEGKHTHELHLKADGSEVIIEVVVREATLVAATGNASAKRYLHSIAFVTSLNQTIDSAVMSAVQEETTETASTEKKEDNVTEEKKPQVKISSTTWLKPDDSRSSLRGLFGIHYKKRISTIGVIWGKDGLNDIDLNWEIKGIGFATNNKDKLGGLCGLKVTYRNGHKFTYGHYTKDAVAWETNVHPLLSVVRLTAGRRCAEQPTYIDTVEFVSGEENSESLLPAWPRDLKSDRFLGVDENVAMDITTFMEQAPSTSVGGSYAKWSARGFYGEYNEAEQLITQLGVVWGRG